MSQADTDAMVALVESVPILADATHVTLAPKASDGSSPLLYPYALVHPKGGIDEQTRVTGPYSTEHPEFTIHLAGGSAEQVQTITDLLKAEVKPSGVGVIVTVSGRKNQRAYWRQPLPIQTNTSVTPPMCFAVVEVGWISDPST